MSDIESWFRFSNNLTLGNFLMIHYVWVADCHIKVGGTFIEWSMVRSDSWICAEWRYGRHPAVRWAYRDFLSDKGIKQHRIVHLLVILIDLKNIFWWSSLACRFAKFQLSYDPFMWQVFGVILAPYFVLNLSYHNYWFQFYLY